MTSIKPFLILYYVTSEKNEKYHYSFLKEVTYDIKSDDFDFNEKLNIK